MKWLFVLISVTVFLSCSTQEVKIGEVKYNQYKPSTRGLYCVDEKIFWASGTNGVIQISIDGEKWVSFFEGDKNSLDFRDLHAFSDKEAIIMSSGYGCKMYKTNDAGKTWNLVYNNPDSSYFFDGMDFWDNKNGMAFGDPINNQIYLIKTTNGGETWEEFNPVVIPKTMVGEAGFAASGTGIQCLGDSTIFIGTGGGEISRVFVSYNRGKTWQTLNTTMRKGEASGIYSLTFLDELNGVVVGGNYLDSTSIEGNCEFTNDGGKTWNKPITPPNGYRSCVAYNNDGVLIACGRTGVDVSFDYGKTWKQISNEGFYTCALKGKKGWLFGRNGKYAPIAIQN